MPIHDWTRVNAGTSHDFHNSWIIHLKEALNGGRLPRGYYAMSEQHAGRVIADILTLHDGGESSSEDSGGTAVLAPPRVSRKVVMSESAAYRTLRKTLAIRHVSSHRLVALLEVVSPANKDRESSVEDFVAKAHAALQNDCNLLVVDLFAPGKFDLRRMHGEIWDDFADPAEEPLPLEKPLTLSSYVAAPIKEAYLEPMAVGDVLPDMPLFLSPHRYVNVPLEAAYLQAFRGMPAFWRGVLEGSEGS